jgi:hypothetical protein
MLREKFVVAIVAVVVGLALPSKSGAWGCYHNPDYFRPSSSPDYFRPTSSPDYFRPGNSPDYFRPISSPDYFRPGASQSPGYSGAYGYFPANSSGYSRRW